MYKGPVHDGSYMVNCRDNTTEKLIFNSAFWTETLGSDIEISGFATASSMYENIKKAYPNKQEG